MYQMKIKSIKKITNKSKRYDIQTSNHNYFANNILVHNCNMYRDHFHARSLEMASGEDRARVKTLWASIAHEIPKGWRFCGENLYATHSIHYNNLESYFYLFSIWNDLNECLSWDDTKEWAELLGLSVVPELYRGPWNESLIKSLYKPEYNGCIMEGYVVRSASSFHYRDFRHLTCKFVRPNHVTTATHWKHKQVVPNELAIKKEK